MRWLKWLAAGLAGAITAMSIVLILILAGSVSLARLDLSIGTIQGLVLLVGYTAWLAWPLFALVAGAMLVLLALAAVRREMRTVRRGVALLLGAIALSAAWRLGIRPPVERTGVFAGTFVYGYFAYSPDYLLLCEDPAHPLPRGADLVLGAIEPRMPVWLAIHVPDQGWHGSHPREWPSTASDSHGGQYWKLRVRGTLRGPAQYGRPALMQYRLDVDSVLSVRSRRGEDECGVDHPPPDRPPGD